MPQAKSNKSGSIVVSALHARSNFGSILRRVEKESRSLVIEKRGIPRAILLSIHVYVRLAAPEPAVLKALGDEARQKGVKPTSRQIDRIIRATRASKSKS